MNTKSRKRGAVVLVAIFIASALLLCVPAWVSAGAESGYTGIFVGQNVPEGTDIKNETNTYNSDGTKNENTVSAGAPQLTVLTHGYASHASDWSNDYEYFSKERKHSEKLFFCYDPDSLIEQLRVLSGGAEVYWAQFDEGSLTEFKLYPCFTREAELAAIKGKNVKTITDEELKAIRYVPDDTAETREKLTDVSQHIIVVFESQDGRKSNDYVYSQFDFMMDKLVYDIKRLSGGVLPKVNLIGHSRGGITNMQYALEHPDLVDSLFSMGTPYGGSLLGQSEFILNQLNMSAEPTNESYTDGVGDIMNPAVYNSYRDRWNEGYDEKYSKIHFYPIAGYSSLDFVNHIINDDEFNCPTWLKVLVSGLNTLSGIFKVGGQDHLRFDNTAIYLLKAGGLIADIGNLKDKEFWNVADIFAKIIVKRDWDLFTRNWTVYDDLFINVESQLAYGYNGDTIRREWRKFRVYDTDMDKVSQPDTSIVHNLEARDEKIIKFVLANIQTGKVLEYVTSERETGKVCIEGYYGALPASDYIIPSEIQNKTVSAIGSYAYANNFYGKNVKTVTIPSGVTHIENGAFFECTQLESVIFEEGSNLQSIGAEAFAGCSRLTSVTLPESVTEIGAEAFAGCTGLTRFTIGKNANDVSTDAFIGCSALSSLNAHAENARFASSDGVLFDKSMQTLLVYPSGKSDSFYRMPDSVTEVERNAFAGNMYIVSIDLNAVRVLREYAFYGCKNLGAILGENVDFAEWESLSETKWYAENSSDMVILGNTLLEYKGAASEVEITECFSISDRAFAFNDNLLKVVIGGNVSNIGSLTFYGCKNLNEVQLLNGNNLIFVGTGTFASNSETRKIFVPYPLYKTYCADAFWQAYSEDIVVHETQIVYNTNGGNACENGTVAYKGYLTLPVPTKEGFFFAGWYDNALLAGEPMNEQTQWQSMEESVTFYAKWDSVQYLLTYHTNGGVLESTDAYYNVTQDVTFAIPTKTGYTFAGWYYDAEYTQNAGTGFAAGETGDKSVYAKWTANVYTVALDGNGDEKDPGSADTESVVVTYNESFVLPVATRNGYIFNGWKTADGELYTSENGMGFKPWDVAQDVMLFADWTRKQFYIQVNANGTITWLGSGGFTNEKTPIAYGTTFMSAEELEQKFNPQKISYKSGHKFVYFTLEDGTKFTSWAAVPNLGENGTIFSIHAYFVKEVNFNIIFDGYTTSFGVNPFTADYGEPITLMQPQEREGYTFRYWKVASVEKVAGNSVFVGTHLAPGTVFQYQTMPDLSVGREEDGNSISLEAYFVPNTYTVSFSTPYGSTPSSMRVTYNAYSLLPTLSVLGRMCNGWYTQPNGGGNRIANESGILENGRWTIAGDCTLYAKWTAITYSITYYLNGGQYVNGESNPTTYTIDTPTFTLYNPVFDGNRFMGWHTNAEYTGERVTAVVKGSTGNKSFHAKWAELFLLQFSENGYINSYYNIEGTYGQKVNLVNHSNKGYTWSGYEMGAEYTIVKDEIFYLREKSLSSLYNNLTGYYEIWTFNQLNSVRAYTSSKHKLMTNIEMPNTSWVPIPYFSGVFDGNNWGISNLKINETVSDREMYGLFGENTGTIRNLGILQCGFWLTLNNSLRYPPTIYGGFVAAKNYGIIRNCDVTGSYFQFAYLKVEYNAHVGAICGYNGSGATVDSCTIFEVSLSNWEGAVGGIVGYNAGGHVQNCDIDLANVSCRFNYAGGIVGLNESGYVRYNKISDRVTISWNGEVSDSRTLAPEMGTVVGRAAGGSSYISGNVANGVVNSDGLQEITWKGGFLNLIKYSHNQAQYATGAEVGRYV